MDDLAVQAGFEQLWVASNPNAKDPMDRVEQGAWIVQTAAGLEIVPFTNVVNGPCSIQPIPGSFAIPSNAVGWLHTHPFQLGETQVSCDPVGVDPAGNPRYGSYTEWANDEDMTLAWAINTTLGRNIPAYTIDKSQINYFTATSSGSADTGRPFRRCGY